jgi:iron complex outermembrane recepter protein
MLAATSIAALLPHAGHAAVKDLDEVVVTAAPYVVSIDSTTTSVNVVKREELDLAAPAGLGDVLANIPGVRSSAFGPGASRPVIRGLSGPRVMVLTNGVGMIDASSLSPDHQVASDPQEAERIEVLRGPAALAYGGSAIGGVVNIIDGHIPSDFRSGLHGRALASVSSVDDGRELSGEAVAGFADHWSLTASGVRRRTADFEVPVASVSRALAAQLGDPAPLRGQAKVANSYAELDNYGAGVSYVGDAGWGGLSIKRTASNYGSPAEADVHIQLRQTRLDLRAGHDLDVGPFEKVRFSGGYADYRHTEFEGATPGTTFLSDGFEGRLELVQGERGGWQGAVGVQALHRNFDAIGEEALIPKTRIDEVGIFTLQRLDQGAWGLEGGLRADRRSVANARADRNFTNVSASFAAFVRPAEGWFAGVSIARASRAPTEEELSSLGAHPATGVYEVGDATLRKEVSYSVDASLHYGRGPWSLDLHAFYVDYGNFIDLVPTGATDADSGFPVQAFTEGKATYRGVEAEASVRLWRDGDRSFRLEASGDYVRGTTAMGPAVRVPPWSLTGRGVFETGIWTASLEMRTVGRQTRLSAFELPTDGYTLVHGSVTVRPWRARPTLKVFIDGRNLTNVEAREHVSFLKDVAPLPGRNLRLGAAYSF